MLSGEEIQTLRLIDGAHPNNYRATSYDLRAGKIIAPGGKIVDSYNVPPQGIVEIISQESLTLPDHVSGFATVKTGLSTNGLLALNIGIIDPLYRGKLSSFLVNFSKVDFLIENGDVFLRTHFARCETSGFAKESGDPEGKYESDKKKKMVGRFGTTFLNVDKIVNEIIKEYALKALLFVGVLALIVTFANYLANMSVVSLLRSWVDPKTSIQREIEVSVGSDLKNARAETRRLRAEIAQLQSQLNATSRDSRANEANLPGRTAR